MHQLSSRDQWHLIVSEQNPADVLSGGLLPGELRDNSLWWHGPERFLQSAYSTTVIGEPTHRDDFDCELWASERTLKTSLLSSKSTQKVSDKVPYRFVTTWLIKQDQSRINLSDPASNLKSLNIFEDDKGVLRVGGRQEKASIPYGQKHLAILAKNSKFSKVYFIALGKKLFHIDPQGLLNAIRLRFWALGGRNLVRKTVHTCVVCFKCKSISSSPAFLKLCQSSKNETSEIYKRKTSRRNIKGSIPPIECPARIVVSEKGEGISIKYFSKHNHELCPQNIKFQPIQKTCREFIEANLQMGIEKSKLLEYVRGNREIRNDRDKCLIKEFFLTNKNLSYYVNSLKSLSLPHKDDADSVNILINKLQKELLQATCVLLYKPKGQDTVYGPTSSKMLPNNSLAIGLQTAEQKEITIKNC
ncbi:integrase catalytic domain-containing protein [Trichonephila clavipes]|nr:integrase catalytic domain-containing protein [Trichonephila clavipes]